MPDFATHYLFGTQLQPPAPAQQYPALYNWGLQGPDLFFYRKVPMRGRSPYHELAGQMHNEHTQKLFGSMSAYCCQLEGNAKAMAEAYMYGFAGHYALDSTMHPYVYAWQDSMSHSQPAIDPGVIHAMIESDIDMDIYGVLRGSSVCRLRPQAAHTLTQEEESAVGAMYTHLLYDVYQLLFSPNEVVASLRDTLALQKLLFSGSKPLHAVATLLDRLKGKENHTLRCHLKGGQPQWDSLNLSGAQWEDPWTKQPRSESVPQLMELAAEKWQRLVTILARNSNGAVLLVPADTDFSGKVVQPKA